MKETENTTLDAMLLFRNVHEAIKQIADDGFYEEASSLYLAIGQYGLYGELPELRGVMATMWKLIFPVLENGRAKALAGKKGGKASKHNNPNGRRGKAATATPKPQSESPTRFTPPPVDVIRTYVANNNLKVDAQAFFDYYDKRNWEIDGKPIKKIVPLLKKWNENATSTSVGSIAVKLGYDEFIDAYGRRSYKGARTEVPMNAPPRPADGYDWSEDGQEWFYNSF